MQSGGKGWSGDVLPVRERGVLSGTVGLWSCREVSSGAVVVLAMLLVGESFRGRPTPCLYELTEYMTGESPHKI